MKKFMKLTIASHSLKLLTEKMAKELTPSENAMWFAVTRGEVEEPENENAFVFASDRTRYLRDKTDWYERKNQLVSENDWLSPPLSTFEKSFEKWLTLQKHDVKAVNSLHEWKQSVDDKKTEITWELTDLEESMEAVPNSLGKIIAARIEAKEAEYFKLALLYWNLDKAIEKVKATPRRIGRSAA